MLLAPFGATSWNLNTTCPRLGGPLTLSAARKPQRRKEDVMQLLADELLRMSANETSKLKEGEEQKQQKLGQPYPEAPL